MINHTLAQATTAVVTPGQQGIILSIVAMGVVFLSLTLIGVMMAFVAKLLRDLEAARAAAVLPAAPAALPASVGVPVALEDLDPETLVLLTAAVAATVRQPARISRVHFMQDGQMGSAWAELGRISIQKSHSFRKSHR